jgi:hypothetical protein
VINYKAFNEFWKKNGLIIFDTNVYLNLYNFPTQTTKEIIDSLEKIKNRIWLPSQVFIEFEGRKKEVSNKSFSKYSKIKTDVEKFLDNTISSLYTTKGKCDKFKYPAFDELLNNAIENIKSSRSELNIINQEIANEKKLIQEFLGNDIINGFLQNLKENNQIGKKFSHTELINIYVEGDTRFKLGIPPGFRDKGKLNTQSDDYLSKRKAYGDLIIWKEILMKAKEVNLDILYVTDDQKPDWWKHSIEPDKNTGRESKKLLGPHDELLEEFSDYSTSRFNMLTFEDFFNHLSNMFDIHNSIHLHYELNKLNILDYYLIHKIGKEKEINPKYIVRDLNRHFGEKVSEYNVSINQIEFEDKDKVYVEVIENEVSISGRFNLELVVDGKFKKGEETVIKSIFIIIEGDCNLKLQVKENFREYKILSDEIKFLNSINEGTIAEISDDIDIYDIYDAKRIVERAIDDDNLDSVSDYHYKLYEVFRDVDILSLEEIAIDLEG